MEPVIFSEGSVRCSPACWAMPAAGCAVAEGQVWRPGMNLRQKYLLVGVLWGVVIGFGSVAILTGLGVAFLFTLVYGDGPWAENTDRLLYTLALLGFVATILICAGAGYFLGRRLEQSATPSEYMLEQRRANMLAGAAVLVAVMGGYQLYAQHTALLKRQGYLEQLLDARHEISTLRIVPRADDRGLDLMLYVRGRRTGRYSLDLRVHDRAGRILFRQEYEIELPGHDLYRTFPLEYREPLPSLVEPNDGGQAVVRHGDTLMFEARLVPLLERRELHTLPHHSAANYLAADSPFHSRGQVKYPVRFELEEGRYRIFNAGSAYQSDAVRQE